MNNLIVPTRFEVYRALFYRVLRWPYLVVGLVCYIIVALIVVVYLMSPATYKSDMALVLPGTGNSSNVSLTEVGQIVSQTTTPFSGGGFNPRVNYKQMLISRSVLEKAASKLHMSMADFGKPKVKLTEQTSIIDVELTSASAEHAHQKAWALYEAFQNELDTLRADEVFRRDESIKAVLQTYRTRSNAARANIVDFQQRSMLVSEDQLDLLISTQSELQQKKYIVESELSNLQQYVDQLSVMLNVSPQLASIGLQLQSDPHFSGYLSELNTASTRLIEYRSSWGESHPQVVTQVNRQKKARQSLINYVSTFAGVDAPSLVNVLTVKDSPKRAELFSRLINAMANISGMTAERNDVQRALLRVGDELKVISREIAELDRLKKEFDLAEAVFTSAAARLEANKADVFASYPVVQLLSEPSNNIHQSNPNTMLAIIAGVFGICLITFGLIVLWQRDNIIKFVLKKN